MDYTELLNFVRHHTDEDPFRLLLQQERYPHVDVKLAAQQLEGRRQAQTKWPSLIQFDNYLYPPKLNREQSSSEATAHHKATLIHAQDRRIVDLTGGMGIDTLFFARQATSVDYVEQDVTLCELMRHNIQALGTHNIEVHQADSMEWLSGCDKHFDIAYIDPARRSSSGKKVAAFEDCTPNLIDHLTLILRHSDLLVVKASPMIDLTTATNQLQSVSEIHIIALRGECKEVLFFLDNKGTTSPCNTPTIHCTNLLDKTSLSEFTFTPAEESLAQGRYCQQLGDYLYEPHAALMKGAPFRLISDRYKIEQLGRNSHLYTSETFVPGFPGRSWKVLQPIQLNKKSIKTLLPEGKAHVVCRNYPVEASTLQKQLGLKEGGTHYVVATSLGNQKIGMLCQEL